MHKTTVYLTAEQVEALRRASLRTGKSQSDLIREGVEMVAAGVPERRFRSMAVGRGDGSVTGRTAKELLRREFGRERQP